MAAGPVCKGLLKAATQLELRFNFLNNLNLRVKAISVLFIFSNIINFDSALEVGRINNQPEHMCNTQLQSGLKFGL